MNRPLRLLVAYDGTGFSGYQVQPGRRTVQGTLEFALERLVGAPGRVRAAGRTDAGVHALGQVVSVEGPPAALDADDVLRRLATVLPSDVSVLDAQRGPAGFEARRSARWREYTYLLWTHPARHPLYHRYALWVKRELDVAKLAEAVDVVRGTYDFSSFARVREDQTPVRTVFEASCTDDRPFVRIRIVGDAFLHQMVRSIVGSALEVGTGSKPVSWMRRALVARNRAAAGAVAPAHGLTLTDVGYDDAPWPRRVPVGWPWSGEVAAQAERLGGLG